MLISNGCSPVLETILYKRKSDIFIISKFSGGINNAFKMFQWPKTKYKTILKPLILHGNIPGFEFESECPEH